MLLSTLRKYYIRVSIPLSWGRSTTHIAKSLQAFSHVEADSAWQMLRVAAQENDPAICAELFENALEEMHHAALFREKASSLAQAISVHGSHYRKPLYYRGEDIAKFMAYQYISEKDIHRQFDAYAASSPDPSISRIFSHIEADEDGHQCKAYERLLRYCTRPQATRYVAIARLKREMELLSQLGEWIGGYTMNCLLAPVYFLSGIMLRTACLERLNNAAWYNQKKTGDAWRVLE
ncbi:MAG TPA: hypothetical protein PLF22_01255 [Pseudomonadales bacterium]|nr:hypothetical protein [Pseudomonadales bacterium]